MVSRRFLVLGAVVVAIALVAGVLLISFLGGAFRPPVDINRVPDLSNSNPQELMPNQLSGQSLIRVIDVSEPGDTSFKGEYHDFYLVIGRAANAGVASGIVNDEYLYYQNRGGSITRTSDWFAYSGEGSVLMWRSGTWFFLVWATNETIRNQAAQALVDHLIDSAK